MPLDFIVILAFFGVVVPWRGAVRLRKLSRLPGLSTRQRVSLYASTIALQWLISAVVLWRSLARNLSWTELGLTVGDAGRTALASALLVMLLSGTQILSMRLAKKAGPDREKIMSQPQFKLMPRSGAEKIAFVPLVVTAAVCEEFLYRGFVEAIFAQAAGAAAAVFISSAFFSAAHVYQGRRGLVATFVVGVVFAAVRIWAGSLVPGIAGHFAADALAGFLAPAVLGDAARDTAPT